MSDQRARIAEHGWGVAAICVLFGVPLLFADWTFLAALDFDSIWTYRATLARGLGYTAGFTFIAVAVGYPLGLMLAIAGRSASKVVRGLVVAYVEFWRNTPLLVQLFWIHFALPLMTGVNTTVLQSSAVAMVANVAAYYTEIARAGIGAVPPGQWDAARALGLSRYRVWRFVVLPQAIRVIIPPSTNLVVSILKASSILSILGVGELMRETVRLSNHTFRVVEFYTFAAALYVVVGLIVVAVSGRLEARFSRGRASHAL